MLGFIFQDWSVNSPALRSCLVLALFRCASACHQLPPPLRWAGFPVFLIYTVLVEWIFGIELSYKARIGPRLRLYHGTGLVVHEMARLGAGCTLRHCTTIGNRKSEADVPVIGDGVDIGSNAVLLGSISIGDGARIGAGSVVLHDVPPGAAVAGNPARKLCAEPGEGL